MFSEIFKLIKWFWSLRGWRDCKIPYFFTYKPSDFFGIWHKSLGDIFTREGVWLIAYRFRDCSALYVTCFKIVMKTTYFWTPIRFFASCALKTISLNSAKTLLISHYKWNTRSLCCENHSIVCSSSSGHLGVKRPIFCTFCRKNSRLVSSLASHSGLAKCIISSDFQAVFY